MDNYHDLKKVYQTVKKNNDEKYALGSKRRLMKNIEKKFKTAMIGTLARCEKDLGFLWGHESKSPLSLEQEKYDEIWQNLRTEILNHCNSQLRAAMDEIMEYDIKWNQYKTEFIIKKDMRS